MQVKLTRVFRGKQVTKNGEMDKVAIKTVENGDKWIGTLFDPKKGTSGTENWKEGDTVEIFIAEKGGYLNFTLKASEASVATEKFTELEKRIKILETSVFGASSAKDEETRSPDPDDF